MVSTPLILLVPEVGIEPTRTQGPGDFESPASTYFTTPAFVAIDGGHIWQKKNVLSISLSILRQLSYVQCGKNLFR